jgi:hypothetical protein
MRQRGGCAMNQVFRLTIAAVIVAFATFPTSVPAQIAAPQIKLTEKHVEGFIAAQKEMSAVVEKMQSAVLSGHVNTKYQAELEAVTKKYGFKNFAEYEAVAANISMVMAAMDPQTGEFADSRTVIKKEIENASTDKTIPEREKKALLKELNEALKSAVSIEFPSNIELVQKYRDKINVINIATYDGDSNSTSAIVRAINE